MNKTFHRIIQCTPRFTGKNILVRNLFKDVISRGTAIKVKGKFGCSFYLPNLVETVSFQIFADGVYEPENIETLIRMIPPNGKFVDIGSNIGSISIPICKRRPDVQVLAVEASPWVFEFLKKNIEVNQLNNIKIFNLALFNADDLELDFFSPKDKFGKGSLASVFTNESVKVRTITLDTLLTQNGFEDVNVIKVDVEGFEKTVFSGGESILSREKAPVVFFEFVDWAETAAGFKPGDAQSILKQYGYSLLKRDSGKFRSFDRVINTGDLDILALKQ